MNISIDLRRQEKSIKKLITERIAIRVQTYHSLYLQYYTSNLPSTKIPSSTKEEISHSLNSWPKTHFNSPQILEYFFRIVNAGEIETEVQVAALVLLERYLDALPPFSQLNILKVLAVSIYTAQKIIKDIGIWGVKDFAWLAGISDQHLRELEIEFLEALEYKLHLSFEEFRGSLISLVPDREMKREI